jgi:hypothetical protein
MQTMDQDASVAQSEGVPIGLMAALCGGIIYAAAWLIFNYLVPSRNYEVGFHVFSLAVAGVEMSALMIGISEWRRVHAKGYLILAAFIFVVTFGLAIVDLWHQERSPLLMLFIVLFLIAGICLGAFTLALLRQRFRAATVLTLVCVTPGLLFLAIWLVIGFMNGKPAMGLTGGLASFFGPWATLAAIPGVFPNAGEFFSLTWALILTLLLLATGYVVLHSGKVQAKCLGLVLMQFVIVFWYGFGFAQLMNCLE